MADHPLLAAGDGAGARRRWLEDFPSLARGDLGRAFEDAARLFPGWDQVGAIRLASFYESDFFRAMAPRFHERLAELRVRWATG